MSDDEVIICLAACQKVVFVSRRRIRYDLSYKKVIKFHSPCKGNITLLMASKPKVATLNIPDRKFKNQVNMKANIYIKA